MDYPEFGKIPRLNRLCTITEKIDGTNGLVAIVPVPHFDSYIEYQAARLQSLCQPWVMETDLGPVEYMLLAGNRTRWITPEADNHGFAKWVKANAEELRQLGPGHHYGEWWGAGIQRGYGQQAKRFSLFNVGRWVDSSVNTEIQVDWDGQQPCPPCCSVVPVLYRGPFRTDLCDEVLDHLRSVGSHAAEGFERPEGIIVWHEAARCYFKATLEKDEEPKTKFKPAHPGQTKGQAGQLAADPGVMTLEHLDNAGLRDWA